MDVLVTGAAGSIGRSVSIGLSDLGWRVHGLDRVEPPDDLAAAGISWQRGDLLDDAVTESAVRDVDAVVHLASSPSEAALPACLESHVHTTAGLLDAMVRHDVGRLVYASSNHAVGLHRRDDLAGGLLRVDVAPRPDSNYGVAKVAAEALLQRAADRHRIATFALRIGSFLDRPTTRRQLSSWLSPADAVRLVHACLTADLSALERPDHRTGLHTVVHGVSANGRGWWDLAPGRAIGYHPVDDAEAYAGDIPEREEDAAEVGVVGGPMATVGADRPALDLHAPGSLLQLARSWLADDPDPTTRAELAGLVETAEGGDADARADLAERFSGRLVFGTAGLRGALGAGPNRMNRVVVTQAAAGLIAYLLGRDGTGGRPPRVVVGFDARHGSAGFAADTAEIIQGAGGEALLLPGPLPTPVLAYAVRALGCAAGVMVTASHNPPQDNGYKVYLGDGSLIVPPADERIAAAIERAAAGSIATLARSEDYARLGDEVRAGYLDGVLGTIADGPRELRLVHTSLHGVGSALLDEVLERAGFVDRHIVAEQARPDPDFPTVAFPNPEEPGAMGLALALAAKVDADLVVANDPDADRCAVAVPDRLVPGQWRMLHGDEVGALLADAVLTSGRPGAYAATIVSCSLLGRLVAAHADTGASVRHAETLTGFKWLTKVDDLAYAYEEALGYCVAPDLVRDKDGISAALLVCDLAARLRAAGGTLVDRLDQLAVRHGLHATDQLSVRVRDLTLIAAAMARLRAEPPTALGGLAVQRVDDLAEGSVEATGLAPTDGIRLALAERGRVVVRPSGTEPKLKAYLEVVVPVEPDTDGTEDETDAVQAARIAAAGRLDAIKTDLAAHLRL
ncbi:hypothetical protein BH20ACT6_BH20ACT6_01030 [soil metagenome]